MSPVRLRRALACAAGLGLALCSCGDGPVAATPSGAGGGFTATPHVPLPRISFGGGPVLGAPRVVLLSYATHPYAASLAPMVDGLVRSPWFATVGAEYGVKSGSLVASRLLPGPPPTALPDGDVRALLSATIAAGDIPPPTADTLYLVVTPPDTTANFQSRIACKTLFGHHAAVSGGTPMVYAVVPTCHGVHSTQDDLQSLEILISIQLINTATDPFPLAAPAHQLVDDGSAWSQLGFEVGDLCPYQFHTEGARRMTRVWSSEAAERDAEPCVPAPSSEPMFGVSPSPKVNRDAASGETLTWQLTGWSAAKVADWDLEITPGVGSFYTQPTLDRMKLNDGGVATLSLTLPIGLPPSSDLAMFVIARREGGPEHIWPLRVLVK